MTNNDKFAGIWRRSRADSGLTQKEVAARMQISRTTVQNWESGYSCPSQAEGFAWFQALGLQPLPYYLELLYPEFERISSADDDDRISSALISAIRDLPPDTKRKILYVLYGDHGSSPLAILELITAHLQTPLRARLTVAETIRTNYEVAEATGTLARPEHIQPNISVLEDAYLSGKDAVKHGKNGYTALKED